MLSIMTMNMQAAALPRAQALLSWLDQRDDHVVILTETSDGPGTAHLLEQARAAGLAVVRASGLPGDRGCALLSRHPLQPEPQLLADISLPGRAVAATLASEPAVTVIGLYVPSSDRAPTKVARKRAYLASVLTALRSLPDGKARRVVMGGDYNVIGRDHQPTYPGVFLGFEYGFLDALAAEFDLVDAYQQLHPDTPAHSWIGRGGNGYRFDYLHVSRGLADVVTDCAYLHQPREQGLTDHAAVTLRLAITPASRMLQHTALSTAGALF